MKRIWSCAVVLSMMLVLAGLTGSCGGETATVEGDRAQEAAPPDTTAPAPEPTGDGKAETREAPEATKPEAEQPEAQRAVRVPAEPAGEETEAVDAVTPEAVDDVTIGADPRYEQQAEQYANTAQYADTGQYEQQSEQQYANGAPLEREAEERAGVEQYEPPSPAGESQYDTGTIDAPQEALTAPAGTSMSLSVPSLGLGGVPVVDGFGEAALEAGTQHVPGTGFPWQEGANTYIAGHRIGYAGTASDHVFYSLPNLAPGDLVILTDENGRTYEYAVTEIMEVSPADLWVTSPVEGRDVVTLQTCIEDFGDYWTEGPDWAARYVVRADRIA